MKRLALLTALLPLAAASAATITVSTAADNSWAGDGLCTLREAIANVNAAADTTGTDCAAGSGAGDTIDFSLTLSATIHVKRALGPLIISRDVTITGPIGGSLRIDGGRAIRVFEIAAGTTSMSDLTVQHGRVLEFENGGGVKVDMGAALNLNNCTLRRNRADTNGGGIENAGTLTMTNCSLSGNKADSGAGLDNGGTAALINCTINRNRASGRWGTGDGGGIWNSGTLTLTDCSLRGNMASGFASARGGGIASWAGSATLTNCTLIGNRARGRGAGAFAQGGGILNNSVPSSAPNLTLTNCTLRGNQARGNGGAFGGAIDNGGTTALTNCTLDRNKAGGQGGGGGGGIVNESGNVLGGVLVTNTIIAHNGRGDCAGPITSGGYNLSSDDTCFATGGSDLATTNPHLAPLDNYGGPTQTLALCTAAGAPSTACTAASPAIDAGDDAVTGPPDNLATDQRGLPRKAGAHVDIGAYEAQ